MITFNPEKILVPTDFSAVSKNAIQIACNIALTCKSKIYLLHVHHSENFIKAIFENSEEHASVHKKLRQQLIELSESVLAKHNLSAEIIIKDGSPKKEITATAQEIDAGLIVMGTHGYSPLEELFIGSNTLKVIANAPCPVIASSVAPKTGAIKNILLPIDTSIHARQKVKFAIEYAKTFGATIHAVGLLTGSEEQHEGSLNVMLSQIKKIAGSNAVNIEAKVLKDVSNRAETTVGYADQNNIDVIIITADQDAEISGLFIGPYKQQILHYSKIPVIIIQPKNLSENTNMIMFG